MVWYLLEVVIDVRYCIDNNNNNDDDDDDDENNDENNDEYKYTIQ